MCKCRAKLVLDFNDAALTDESIMKLTSLFNKTFLAGNDNLDYRMESQLHWLVNSIIGYTYNVIDGEMLLNKIEQVLGDYFDHITYESVIVLNRTQNFYDGYDKLNYIYRLLNNGEKFFEISLSNRVITLFYNDED